MSDVIFHVGNATKAIKDSPAFQPFSMVRIIVGTDENGDQLVYEAGEETGRVLEVENPWGTQQMANDMLERILGYEYKPFAADGSLIDPAAELGDAVTVGVGDDMVYSVINSVDTTISPIMSATISALESSDIDHEYPYEDRQSREVVRKVNEAKTSLTVEMGRISAVVQGQIDGLSSRLDMTESSISTEIVARKDDVAELSSSITQTVDKINAEIVNRQNGDNELRSQLSITALQIQSTVASAQKTYDTTGYNITCSGYGGPTPAGFPASEHPGEYYLNQSNGLVFYSNGSSWTWVKTLTPITTNLSSRITQTAESITLEVERATSAEERLSSSITQTASNIRAEVFGTYADEWEEGVGEGNEWFYNPGDIVKVTTTTEETTVVTFYECIRENDSDDSNKPGSGQYWESYWEETNAPSIDSLVDVGIDGITLSYEASDLENSAVIKLNRNGIEMQAQTITMTNVVADELSADYIFSDGMSLYGAFKVFAEDDGLWKQFGAIGASFGNDGVVSTKGTMLRSAYYRGDYNYLIATAGASGGVRMQAGDYSLYVTRNGVFASDGETTRNLLD